MEQLTQTMSLSFTRDELLAILQLMGSTSMNGLPEDPWAGIAEKERAERLNGGLETLFNRGLVEARAVDSLVLDDTLVALVGSCVIPDASLLLSVSAADGAATPRFLDATREILVEHAMPRPGIHEFRYLPDAAVLAARIQAVLAPITDIAAGADFAIRTPDKVIASVLECARTNRQAQAIQTLTAAWWPVAQAEALVMSCAGYPIYTAICAWGLRRERPEGSETLMAISDGRRCWLLTTEGPRGDVLHIRAVAGSVCLAAFVRITERLVKAAG